MPLHKIEITVYCGDREVYIPGGRAPHSFEDYVLSNREVQRACMTKAERKKAIREDSY